MGKYFGTDGVRGRANDDLTPGLAYAVGRAAAAVFAARHEAARPLVLIGKDTRISGDMLEAALAAGITSAGCDVLLLGVLPTPGVAVLTRLLQAAAGAVISASHNPYDDNGIKFFSADGYKLPDAVEAEIEALIDAPERIPRVHGAALGRIERCQTAQARYGRWLLQQLAPDLHGLRLVIDAANGAASPIAAELFSRLGADVVVTSAAPDGLNINDGCGSTHMEALQQRVVAERADLGLAFDGDADRMLAVDEKGCLVDGDFIITILARYLRAQGRLTADCVAVTVMSNLGLRRALAAMGVGVEETKVGDRYVLERMREKGLVLGGEQSGHIILHQYNTTGDGMLAALALLQALRESGGTLSQLASVMRRLPQVLVNVRVATKAGWDTDAEIAAAAAAAEQRLAGCGRLLLRPSGTEPVLRVMVEGENEAELEEIAGQLAETIRRRLG